MQKIGSKSRKESKLSRCIKAPIRVLSKARDLYVDSMAGCAGNFHYAGGAMGCPAPSLHELPRSFSVHSSSSTGNEDFRELLRVASTGSLTGKIEAELLRLKQPSLQGPTVVPRSQTVAIGRIDEDKPCEFPEDIVLNAEFNGRSRSYAVSRKTLVL